MFLFLDIWYETIMAFTWRPLTIIKLKIPPENCDA